ncbi:hypothetical protein Aci011_109 [Acinetobacter phage vB_AbaM_B09_Aci01-1]|uniref:Uncharacterized protein n=2 Tax=Saclayvirus TaxID=2733128 RepID=A0A386KNB4_9CAUD|nr:hypothetical protein HOU29_gp072 [Acinetobacter phage vB_AbaM_B09_Aci01-1]YP_009813332.1 hypothetical protein HOU30_gp080 [Acinetobacter phage vB_AbaM_B09_Aci02-2]AYD85573.1 hypothetical protein Aci011_109 [Acinetobacter phage vB_AbaM_B09_Aci01-1]AYD85737.1 hypothetical protein Aci022_110 [Acinetobacter phage vB_AbaM_B09_Aci02-2]
MKFYHKKTVGDINKRISELKQEIREAEEKVQLVIKDHLRAGCKTFPEVVELSKELGCSFEYVVDGLGPKRKYSLWSNLMWVEVKSGHDGLILKLENVGILEKTYYYCNNYGGQDLCIGDEEAMKSFECEDGIWACPIKGEEISKEEFDENLYPMFSTTDKYHDIWKKLSEGIDNLLVFQ